jgi:hypothetical protein
MLWLYNVFGLIVFLLSLLLYTFLSTVQQTFEKDRKTGTQIFSALLINKAKAKTVMIRNVSYDIVDEEILQLHFEDLYPLQVAAIHIVPDISGIVVTKSVANK